MFKMLNSLWLDDKPLYFFPNKLYLPFTWYAAHSTYFIMFYVCPLQLPTQKCYCIELYVMLPLLSSSTDTNFYSCAMKVFMRECIIMLAKNESEFILCWKCECRGYNFEKQRKNTFVIKHCTSCLSFTNATYLGQTTISL